MYCGEISNLVGNHDNPNVKGEDWNHGEVQRFSLPQSHVSFQFHC